MAEAFAASGADDIDRAGPFAVGSLLQVEFDRIAHAQVFEAQAQHQKGAGLCPYGALGFAALGGADPIQLAAALAFVLTLGFAALVVPAPRTIAHLRPPLRGPPLLPAI